MTADEAKSEHIVVLTPPGIKVLLEHAARVSHKCLTEFLLEAGIHAAEEALVERLLFQLDDVSWQAFQRVLDRPVEQKPRLARLLSGKSILE